jgi:putative Mg2+ transporter-C (MgtC) family protein
MDVVVERLVVAALLGAAVGWEREAADQPAGLRTHLTVSLGAALFGVVSTLGFTEFDGPRADTVLQADVTRVASQVAVGIGFLGAGVIFRQGDSVRNLTTAASLWVTAAIGVAAGVGNPGAAAVCTAALLFALLIFRWPRALIRRHLRIDRERVELTLLPGSDPTHVIDAIEQLDGVTLEQLAVRKAAGCLQLVADLAAERGADLEPALAILALHDEVASLQGGAAVAGGSTEGPTGTAGLSANTFGGSSSGPTAP